MSCWTISKTLKNAYVCRQSTVKSWLNYFKIIDERKKDEGESISNILTNEILKFQNQP